MADPPVPTGLQRLLRLAAADSRFRAELIERRSAIAAPAATALSASERAILDAVPAAQLAAMIDGLPPVSSDRRTFLRDAAAAALVVLSGGAMADCAKPAAGTPADGGLHEGPPQRRKQLKCFGHLSKAARAHGITDPCSPEAALYPDDQE
jgi:hypothetical protein